MSMVALAVEKIRLSIPRQVLEATFNDSRLRRANYAVNIDTCIREEIINRKVRVDTNLVGGMEILINLSGCPMQIVTPYETVITIPKSKTNGRTITVPLSISLFNGFTTGNPNGFYYGSSSQSVPLDAARGVMNSYAPTPIVSLADVSMVGENTIMIRGMGPQVSNCGLRCIVEMDSEMNSIQPTTGVRFFELCVLAAKSYIYNRMIVTLDEGHLKGGFEIGAIRNVIESYADAESMYVDYLKDKWTKILMMNDRTQHRRALRKLVGGNN